MSFCLWIDPGKIHPSIFPPIQSHPIPSNPIPSNPIQSHPILSHPLPSHPPSIHIYAMLKLEESHTGVDISATALGLPGYCRAGDGVFWQRTLCIQYDIYCIPSTSRLCESISFWDELHRCKRSTNRYFSWAAGDTWGHAQKSTWFNHVQSNLFFLFFVFKIHLRLQIWRWSRGAILVPLDSDCLTWRHNIWSFSKIWLNWQGTKGCCEPWKSESC